MAGKKGGELEALAKLARLGKTVGVEGQTLGEIATAAGLCRESVNRLLRVAKEHGRLKAMKGYREAIDGRMMMVPVYTILDKPAK
jgi:hypothetical protein